MSQGAMKENKFSNNMFMFLETELILSKTEINTAWVNQKAIKLMKHKIIWKQRYISNLARNYLAGEEAAVDWSLDTDDWLGTTEIVS
jgi:hypothetical protein